MIGIVDCNNFYVSCERVFNPKLEKQPVVVLSNNDGCIISRSNEAKALGIKMGEAAFKLENFFKKNNVRILSANFELYADMSKRVMDIIIAEVPKSEIYSIDEAFIDLKGIKNPIEFSENLRKKILKWTGIPISIGIGKTKTLAKVAVKFAKKKKGNILMIDDENYEFLLKRTNVEDIWGIGKRTAKKLRENFIYTAWDFVRANDYFVKKTLSINGLRTKKELQGIEAFKFTEDAETKKSVRTGRTFGKEIEDLKTLEEAFAFFADNVASKLRKEKLIAKYLTVYLRTNYYNEKQPFYAQSYVIPLDPPTNSSLVFVKAAILGLRKIYLKNFKYKKGTVVASDLEIQNFVQTNLFENNIIKHKKLMATIDNIRKNYGKKSIKFAIQDNLNDWKSIRKNISKPYTTNWNELLKVK